MESNFVEITQSENYHLDRVEVIDKTKLKSDFVAYRPTSLVAVNGTSPFNIIIPREDVFADPRDSYVELEVQIVKNADNSLYADNDDIQPNNLFGISLFREMLLNLMMVLLFQLILKKNFNRNRHRHRLRRS